MASLPPFWPDRREVLPSMAMTSAETPVSDATQPAKQIALSFAEAGNLGKALRPGQHAKQAEQQHLVQRVAHLADLPMIRQVFEMIQKDDRLVDGTLPNGPT